MKKLQCMECFRWLGTFFFPKELLDHDCADRRFNRLENCVDCRMKNFNHDLYEEFFDEAEEMIREEMADEQYGY